MSMRIVIYGYLDSDLGAAARYRARGEASSHGLCALAHRHHAEPVPLARIAVVRSVDADTVVGDAQDAMAVGMCEVDLHASRIRVLGDVRQRFLRDAKERDLDLGNA